LILLLFYPALGHCCKGDGFMEDLHGKVALVTGASRGIGRAVAESFAKAGMDVAVNFFSREKQAFETGDLVRKAGQRSILVQADVSSSIETARMIRKIEDELGPVQVLVNNAGIAIRKSLDEITEEDWDRVLSVNLKSAFLVTQAVVPGMRERKWGRIVNISSIAAQTGGITAPPYVASKAGIWGLTHSYAALLMKDGITVNTVSPALIETDMVRELEAKPDRIPLGRFGKVEEVADVVLMLAQNGYITGQTINVNGGWYFS
jgi:3-oxoacyl-[acyl-carrier protein] reductase